MAGKDGEEDDYLTMTFAEPERGLETYSQRRARKLREHETNSNIKPIKELEKERREEGLEKNLFDDRPIKETKAMRMMKMMGYKEGQGLGIEQSYGNVEPIRVEMPEGRKGIGHDMEKKRKLNDLYKTSSKRQKEDSDNFRDALRSERSDAQLRQNLRQAQETCQTLDTEAAERYGKKVFPNVLWQGLVKERDAEEMEKRRRHRMYNGRTTNVLEEDEEVEYTDTVQPLEGEETELEEFEALSAEEQLEKLLHYMREKYFYCFWCGCAYKHAQDLEENCPGLAEDNH